MSGQRKVILNFPELRGDDHGDGIFLAINGALLQRGKHFRERHWGGMNAHLLEGLHVYLVFHGTHLQPLGIVRAGHRANTVGHVAEAVFRPGKAHQVMVRHLVQQVLADLAIKYTAGLFVTLEKKRQVKHITFRYEIPQRTCRCNHNINGANLQALDHGPLPAQGTGRVLGDLKLSATEALQSFLKGIGAHGIVGTVRQRMAKVNGSCCLCIHCCHGKQS